MVNKARLASELLGVGSGGGALEKLTITYKKGKVGPKGEVEALFNPSEISIARSIGYEEKRVASKAEAGGFHQQLRSIEPATLSIELFFDTYEARSDTASWKRAAAMLTPTNPFQSGDSTDVRSLTDEVTALATPDKETHRPPVCTLSWGRFDIFVGVLTSLDQRFTMFLGDGTPVRATLSCSFVETGTEAGRRAGELHSADIDKARVVRRHDTLQSIAAEEYDDPGLWRSIAKANGITNPRVVKPGTTLMIPRLRS